MPKYRCHAKLIVTVTSEVCEAENPGLAFREFFQKVDFERLLRNARGTRLVSSVRFNREYDGVIVDELDDNANFVQIALEYDGDRIYPFLPVRTSSSSGN